MKYIKKELEKRISQDLWCSEYKDQETLALEVTDEKAHDGKVIRKLVNGILNSREPNKVKIKSVLADGAYNSSTKFPVS